jgi:hypothetical protein
LPVPLAEPLAQPGSQGTLGGQVVFQVQDPQRGGQGVALVEQLPGRRVPSSLTWSIGLPRVKSAGGADEDDQDAYGESGDC